MARRWYLSQVVAGPALAGEPVTRPAIAELGVAFWTHESEGAIGTWALVEAEVTTQEHNAIRADARNLTLPFEENGTGRILGLDESTDLMAQLDRDRVINRLEGIGIALHDFAGKTVRQVLRRAIRRNAIRRWLGPEDLPAGLDSTWGQLSSARRAAIRDVFEAHGVDATIINGPDTIRVVQKKVLDQNVPALRTHLDEGGAA